MQDFLVKNVMSALVETKAVVLGSGFELFSPSRKPKKKGSDLVVEWKIMFRFV